MGMLNRCRRPLFLVALGLAVTGPVAASQEDAPGHVEALISRVEVAYRAGDPGGIEAVRKELLGSTGVVAAQAPYLAAYARFRQSLLAADDDDRARAYLEDCIAELRRHAVTHPGDAQARALLGSCYGMSTRYNRLGTASRGLEARRHMAAAVELAPANPWVMMQDGLADYSTPRLFGGDRKAGLAKLERATALFETAIGEGSRLAAWGAAEAWQQLALMYRAAGREADAGRALAESRRVTPVGERPARLAAL